MGLLSTLWSMNNSKADFDRAFGAEDLTSSEMQQAVREWYDMYLGRNAERGCDDSMRLPYTVVEKLTKTMFSEYQASYPAGTAKAGHLQAALDKLVAIKNKAMQHAMIAGESLLKPVVTPDGIDVMVIQRPNYAILGKDSFGRVTSYGTTEVTRIEQYRYTLVERRTVGADGRVTVESKLFRAYNSDTLGDNVPLNTLDKYKNLKPRITWPIPMHCTGLIPVCMPLANCVDGSDTPVSVYASAAGLIRNIYRLEAQLNKEFANSASRVIASRDMLTTGKDGKKKLNDDLFIALDDDPSNVGITVFSPDIREQNYLARKNDHLRSIENVIGIKRGILSEVEATERTATEITNTAGDYNLTIQMLQGAWGMATQQYMAVCNALGQMYLGWDGSDIEETTQDFGDGVLFNRDKVWQEYERMVQFGWLKPEIALAWYFGIDATDTEALAKSKEFYMPPGMNYGD